MGKFDHFAEEVVYAHGGEGFFVPFRGEGRFENVKDGLGSGLWNCVLC